MEFSVSKSALLNELTTTQGVVERKTTIPILSNLLVEAKGDRLMITATDLELSVRTSCEAKIKKEGAGTIPAKKRARWAVYRYPFEKPRFLEKLQTRRIPPGQSNWSACPIEPAL